MEAAFSHTRMPLATVEFLVRIAPECVNTDRWIQSSRYTVTHLRQDLLGVAHTEC